MLQMNLFLGIVILFALFNFGMISSQTLVFVCFVFAVLFLVQEPPYVRRGLVRRNALRPGSINYDGYPGYRTSWNDQRPSNTVRRPNLNNY
tara:strand:- start:42 stop:314 length:273 start_codon:yes stop_codon:yes gene_type:complete